MEVFCCVIRHVAVTALSYAFLYRVISIYSRILKLPIIDTKICLNCMNPTTCLYVDSNSSGFSHQSKGVYIGQTKKEDLVLCLGNSHIAWRGRESL